MTVIRLSNHGPSKFSGWKRATVDVRPPHKSGKVDGMRFVLGREVGNGVHVVDLKLTLQPGESRTVNLEQAQASRFELPPPRDAVWTGGPMRLQGRELDWVSLEPDGAAWIAHLRGRYGTMMHADVWLRHYPDEPFAHGELLVTASNPDVPDITEQAGAFHLSFGTGAVMGFGRAVHEPLIDPATYSDGQARCVPFGVVWPIHASDSDWANAATTCTPTVGAAGIKTLLHDGNPIYPDGFDALQWAAGELPSAVDALHDWRPTFAIASNSGQSGSQEEQLFARGEARFAPGAEWVAYLSGCKWANRPSHFLERNGDQLDPGAHPELVLWGARPHHSGTDRLGKPALPSSNPPHWEVPGQWAGPDRQHWLANTLTAGARYTGSHALQHLLRNQALIYLLGYTVDPTKATSSPGAARAVGYEGIMAVHLYENLEDRDMAQKVKDRWIARVQDVIIPSYGSKPGNIWDPRRDSRITGDLEGYEYGQQNYQQAMGCYGLDLGCAVLGPCEGREMALAAAQAVVDHSWRKQPNGNWIHWDHTGYSNGEVLPESELFEGKGAHRTGWFENTWCLPGIAVLLRHDPAHAVARDIWSQHGGPGSWRPPGVK